jgi:tetratricopeptide (TPR) repeat protein
VKSIIYDQATVAYNSKDYSQALKLFYQCLKEEWSSFGPGDAGLVYHRIGNCLIKMRKFKEAAVSYQKALQDLDYTEKTSIYVNLGTTLNGIGKYAEATTYFNKALDDASYATPYRAHMGLGSAYTKLDKLVEAGIAYRDAALDESNPNPVKALMNLGGTFTALGRPDDAVEAYLAILDFRVTGDDLNKTLDLLGQAYVQGGHYQEGLNTFEEALSHERFSLTPEGETQYQKARTALGLASTSTVAMPAVNDYQEDDFSGFDRQVHPDSDRESSASLYEFDEDDGYGGGNVPSANDTGFFTLSDDDLIATGKQELRKERKLRNTGLKILLIVIIILILALGASVVAYTQGVGFPSKEAVVTDFFKAYAASDPKHTDYWVSNADIDRASLQQMLDRVAKSDSIAIVGSEATMTESYLLVDVKLSQGGVMHYRVNLVRDVISWKISGIEIIFASNYDPAAQ